MNPNELTDDEMLALVCLSRVLIAADDELSDEELQEFNEIGHDLGLEAFARVSKRAEQQPMTDENALQLAAAVTRPDARDLLRTMLIDLAAADGIDVSEKELLSKLEAVWAK
ncbi:MAG: putative tellurite resistance protein B-like protein [Kiritimatiellia bacterium]|jgi:uncharacterized tellurite resistance protein B-like protein